MDNSEKIFNINSTLRNLSKHLQHLFPEKKTALIFDMQAGIPRELRGDDVVLARLLNTLLTFIFKETAQAEILLYLDTAEDFLYEEDISFMIEKSGIDKEKIALFLESGLGKDLETLGGRIVYESKMDVHIKIPFNIGELGFRRHYRLPFTTMLKKKILLIIESEQLSKSMAHMFQYFQYEVNFGTKEETLDLISYDLVIIENCLVIESFADLIREAQAKKDLHCVLLGEKEKKDCVCEGSVAMQIKQPMTQESVFELIVFIFDQASEIHPHANATQRQASVLLDMKALYAAHAQEKLAKKPETKLDKVIKEKRTEKVVVLNVDLGKERAKEMGLDYKDELKKFSKTFEHSDLYFRKIVNEKSTSRIKDFCIDLEKKSKVIGAESMTGFANIVSLIFVYDKLDLLPIYPGRYHLELQKLLAEITRYLSK